MVNLEKKTIKIADICYFEKKLNKIMEKAPNFIFCESHNKILLINCDFLAKFNESDYVKIEGNHLSRLAGSQKLYIWQNSNDSVKFFVIRPSAVEFETMIVENYRCFRIDKEWKEIEKEIEDAKNFKRKLEIDISYFD